MKLYMEKKCRIFFKLVIVIQKIFIERPDRGRWLGIIWNG